MAERVQSYKNHTRLLPPFHFFVLPVLLVNFVNADAPPVGGADAALRVRRWSSPRRC